jgi:exodeoxyribonuclease V alpha subunit
MSPYSEPSTQEVLAGLVERVTYHNAENGFCVLRARARGHRDVVTVVGHAASISAGEWITASGDWVNDRTHGQQFKAMFLRTSPPTSADGIEKYLSSGMIRGVGPVYAKKLVRAFGEKVFDIIETTPDRLREVDGIGPVRAASILAAWAEQKAVREIMVFLHSHGVSTARAVRIFKTYGSDAIQVMSENPYRLARDIRGIGFKTADAIAMKLGIEKTALIRVRAGISYALSEAMDEGHCGLPTDQLVPLAEKLLEVPQQLIQTALELELTDGTVIVDRVGETPCVFLAGLYRAERTIAERLARLANGTLPWPWIDPDKALPWVEKRIGLALAESQIAEVYNGDIGYIDDVDPNAGEIAVSFDGRSVTYGFGELDMLVSAYAATIHKSQGSEYSAVIIPVLTQHYAMLQRNLLYTGVTRGKRLVVLVGQKKAVAIAVRNASGRRRWSKLAEWLARKPAEAGG